MVCQLLNSKTYSYSPTPKAPIFSSSGFPSAIPENETPYEPFLHADNIPIFFKRLQSSSRNMMPSFLKDHW